MKIGIFGGSFNPPHKMHEEISSQLIKKGYVDKIIFVPTGMKYQYKNNLIDNHHREEMLKRMIQSHDNFDISTYEFQEEVIYTYQTLEHFQKKYPTDEIYFICGADNLSYMDQWKRGEFILEHYKILVINRKTDSIDSILQKYQKYQKNIIITDITPVDISSTYIREKLKENNIEEARKYLKKEVLDYIEEMNLYKERI